MTFRDWLDWKFYPDFDVSGLTDEEYYELEDAYREYEDYVVGCAMEEEDYII